MSKFVYRYCPGCEKNLHPLTFWGSSKVCEDCRKAKASKGHVSKELAQLRKTCITKTFNRWH